MQITIRKAVKSDCEAIMNLVKELAIYEKEPAAVTVSLEHFVESGFGEKPVWEVYVASPNLPKGRDKLSKGGGLPIQFDLQNSNALNNVIKLKKTPSLQSSTFPPPLESLSRPLEGLGEAAALPFGFALYYIRYSTWKGQRMYLEDFYVTENMRGHGAGKLLFDKLIEECKAKKYSGLVWQVLDWNEPAINFYKKYDGVKFDGEWVNCSMEF